MQAAGVWKCQLCLPVARFFNRHALSSKLRALPLYRTSSIAGLRFDKLKLPPSHGLLQVSSSVEEHTQQNDAGTKIVNVKFILQRRCEFGQQFCVIGDKELLGAWAPEKAVPMQWSEGHIWTVELDLSVGMCMELKIILMAEQEVIEWQPGLNRKVELPGTASSFVVFVPWSDEEDNKPQVDTVRNEYIVTQDDHETDYSASNPPNLVENMETETLFNKSAEEQLSEQRSTYSEMGMINAKEVPDEQQTEAKGVIIGHREALDARASLGSELESSNFTLSFAIPESWYGQEFEQTNEISSSCDLTESSPVSLEDIAKEETLSFDFKFSSDNKEEENGEKLMSLNRLDEVISEEGGSSRCEPLLQNENDEERRARDVLVEATSWGNVGNFLSDTKLNDADKPDEVISEGRASSMSKPIFKDENDEEQRPLDVLVEATSQRNVGYLLSDTKLEDTNKETTLRHIIQNDTIESIEDSRSETMISTTGSDNQDQSDTEVLVDNDLIVLTTEVPEIEKPSLTTDSLEKAETKPSTTAKKKKWDRKGWSKLWDAFVQGRMN